MFKSILIFLVINFKNWAGAPEGIIYAHPFKNNPLNKNANTQVLALDEKNEWSRLKKWRQILTKSHELYPVAGQWDLAQQDQFILKARQLSSSDMAKQYPEFKEDKIKNFQQAIMGP